MSCNSIYNSWFASRERERERERERNITSKKEERCIVSRYLKPHIITIAGFHFNFLKQKLPKQHFKTLFLIRFGNIWIIKIFQKSWNFLRCLHLCRPKQGFYCLGSIYVYISESVTLVCWRNFLIWEGIGKLLFRNGSTTQY